jgi:hypothetical protein
MGCYLTNKALMLSYLMVLIMLHHLTILNNVPIYLSLDFTYTVNYDKIKFGL